MRRGVCTEHTPTEPAPGAGGLIPHQQGSPKKAIKAKQKPLSLEGAQALGSLSWSSKLCFLHAWLELGAQEPSIHTWNVHRHRALHPLPASPGASGSRARGAWGTHQAALASEELPLQPEVAGAKPHSLSQAAGQDRWHQEQCPELTQSKLPAAGPACTAAELPSHLPCCSLQRSKRPAAPGAPFGRTPRSSRNQTQG